MDFSAAERARRIRLILFDVDGVLTDGKIWTLPLASVSQPSADPAGQTFEPKGLSLIHISARKESSLAFRPVRPLRQRCG